MIPARATTTPAAMTDNNNNNSKEARHAPHHDDHGSTPSRIHASRPPAVTHHVRPGIAPLVPSIMHNGHGKIQRQTSPSTSGMSRSIGTGKRTSSLDGAAAAAAAGGGVACASASGSRSSISASPLALSSSSSISSPSATSSSSSSPSSSYISSMSSLPSISRTSSCSSRASSTSSSTSSIVRAIDFAYCLPSPGLFDGDLNRRGRSSPSMSMSISSAASSSRRPSSGPLPSLSSSSTSGSSYAGSRSSVSSRRTSSSVHSHSSSSSSSLASRFRDWAINEGPLHGVADQFSSHTSLKKLSLHSVKPVPSPSTHTLSSSPGSTSDVFSPLTAVPPFPASVYPAGMHGDIEDCAVIDDIEGLICFQPGCDTTISAGTYYCHEHDDPFGDDI